MMAAPLVAAIRHAMLRIQQSSSGGATAEFDVGQAEAAPR
jgi:hypothetical protein